MGPDGLPPTAVDDQGDGGAPDRAGAPSSHRAAPEPAADRSTRRRGKREPLPWWLEFPLLIGIALVLALVIKTFLVQAFFIPSGSMEQTLKIGDRVLVEKLSYRFGSIQRGDIVVFDGIDSFDTVPVQPPSNPVLRALHSAAVSLGLASSGHDYIKRVIGVAGDVVACCDAQGRVTVNGVPLDEPYVYDAGAVGERAFGPVKVPAGHLWVMGDHRGNSRDSRYVGPVPADKVVGRAAVIIWPPSHWRGLGRPATFSNPALVHSSPPPVTPSPAASAALGVAAPTTAVVLGRRRRAERGRPLLAEPRAA